MKKYKIKDLYVIKIAKITEKNGGDIWSNVYDGEFIAEKKGDEKYELLTQNGLILGESTNELKENDDYINWVRPLSYFLNKEDLISMETIKNIEKYHYLILDNDPENQELLERAKDIDSYIEQKIARAKENELKIQREMKEKMEKGLILIYNGNSETRSYFRLSDIDSFPYALEKLPENVIDTLYEMDCVYLDDDVFAVEKSMTLSELKRYFKSISWIITAVAQRTIDYGDVDKILSKIKSIKDKNIGIDREDFEENNFEEESFGNEDYDEYEEDYNEDKFKNCKKFVAIYDGIDDDETVFSLSDVKSFPTVPDIDYCYPDIVYDELEKLGCDCCGENYFRVEKKMTLKEFAKFLEPLPWIMATDGDGRKIDDRKISELPDNETESEL